MHFKYRTIFLYIFTEMIPTLMVGLIIFIFTLLSFQTLRLTEFLLIHGVSFQSTLNLIGFLSIRFLPMILPMSLLFASLFTYNRLSNDSEIVALKASGMSTNQIARPALALGIIVFLFSLYCSFYLGPWGAKSFESVISKIGQSKASANIKEGSFSEGFFDMVVYANKVDTKSGKLADLFIYDERSSSTPLTIVSKFGQILKPKNNKNSALLRLIDGQIHKNVEDTYTIVNFNTYDINLRQPIELGEQDFNPDTLNITELNAFINSHIKINKPSATQTDHLIQARREYHKRWALSFSCLIFAVLGVAIGAVTNSRSEKTNGYAASLGVLVIYWLLFIVGDQSVKSGKVPAYLGLWLTNFIFIVYTYLRWKKTAKI